MATLNRRDGIHRGRRRRLARWALGVLALLWPLSAAEPAQPREVQAVFLLNLTRFVRWPDGVFPTEDAPLLIGVLPNDAVAEILADAVRGEVAGKHPLVIRQIRAPADIEGCHLVFLPKTDMDNVARLTAAVKEKPVLTVSDADGFFRLGGHVQFFTRSGQVRLRLDLGNLKRVNLTPSSQLLRVSEVVGN